MTSLICVGSLFGERPETMVPYFAPPDWTAEAPNSRLLAYVQPYDDAVFNVPALPDLLEELLAWRENVLADGQGTPVDVVDSVIASVREAIRKQTYVVFLGD